MKTFDFLKDLDKRIAKSTRHSARTLSRRNLITRLGQILVGTALIPVLPVARASSSTIEIPEIGDPNSCDYWRY